MKRTKIICTIGPACSDEATLTGMIQAGMNVARLNFSHGTYEEHLARIELIRTVRDKLGLPVPILLDTKGPEYRIRTFRTHKVMVEEGQRFVFTTRDVEGDENCVSVSYKNLAAELNVGDIILVNDGLVKFRVREKTETDLICDTLIGGELSDRKSMSFPDKVLHQVYLSEQDKADLLFGIEQDVGKARKPRRRGQRRADPGLLRRSDGRPRRHGRGDPLRGAARHSKAADHYVPAQGRACDHRHGNAGVDDRKAPAHPSGDLGRGKRRV